MMLVVDHVTKSFTTGGSSSLQKTVVENLSFELEENGFLTILGPSGCGKTTLLRLIAGFEQPTSGEIRCDGQVVSGPGADRVVVFQRAWLYPWLNVRDNVAFGLKLAKGPVDWQRVDEVLEIVGLAEASSYMPHQLSGGMQQRAALARALVMSPKVLLMDEPFGALDAQTRRMMQDFLLDLWGNIKTTVVFITHDIEEAILLGDRVAVMTANTANPGKFALDRRIDLPRPRDEMTPLDDHFIDLRRQALETLIAGH